MENRLRTGTFPHPQAGKCALRQFFRSENLAFFCRIFVEFPAFFRKLWENPSSAGAFARHSLRLNAIYHKGIRQDCQANFVYTLYLLYFRKSGKATFSRRFRCALRLGWPLQAANSTLAPRKVFSATHMSRQKTDFTAFTSADVKLCEAFFTSWYYPRPPTWNETVLTALPQGSG